MLCVRISLSSVIAPQGLRNVGKLIGIVRNEEDTRLPDAARQVLQVLAAQIEQLETAIAELEKQLLAWHRSNPVSQRLATIPGSGPIIATAIAATVVEPNGFRSGREFAAWLGLVPRQNSTGGKNRLGGISKRGDQCRSVGDRTAPAAAEPGGSGSASQRDRAHRLGGDAPA